MAILAFVRCLNDFSISFPLGYWSIKSRQFLTAVTNHA
jgi:hypothetical protein